MSMVQQPPRRESYSTKALEERKASLRELPSYKKEAERAMGRQDDLKSLSKRLSSNRYLSAYVHCVYDNKYISNDVVYGIWFDFWARGHVENVAAHSKRPAGGVFQIERQAYPIFEAKKEKKNVSLLKNWI